MHNKLITEPRTLVTSVVS